MQLHPSAAQTVLQFRKNGRSMVFHPAWPGKTPPIMPGIASPRHVLGKGPLIHAYCRLHGKLCGAGTPAPPRAPTGCNDKGPRRDSSTSEARPLDQKTNARASGSGRLSRRRDSRLSHRVSPYVRVGPLGVANACAPYHVTERAGTPPFCSAAPALRPIASQEAVAEVPYLSVLIEAILTVCTLLSGLVAAQYCGERAWLRWRVWRGGRGQRVRRRARRQLRRRHHRDYRTGYRARHGTDPPCCRADRRQRRRLFRWLLIASGLLLANWLISLIAMVAVWRAAAF